MNNRIAWIAALALAAFGSAAQAQTITAVYTTYSDTGVPTKLDITGTAFCTATPCGTKAPVVRLGGNVVGISGSSPTGIGVPLTGLFADGDYLLSVTPSGKTAITYAFTLKSKTGGGATGPQGPVGPQGPAGSPGSQGPMGFTGPQGVKGDTGATGSTGAAGAAGSVGAAGAKGDKGDTGDGFTFKGVWSTGASYVARDVVTEGGSSYIAVLPSIGVSPASSVQYGGGNWALLAVRGADGAVGPAGTAGTAGAQGPQGPQGPQGLKGDTGAAGENGVPGSVGPQGPSGADGAQGPMGLAGLKGDKGDKGDRGDKGDKGDSAPTGSIAPGTAFGVMMFWDGTAWVEVNAPVTRGLTLIFCDTGPVWGTNCPPAGPPYFYFTENFASPTLDPQKLEDADSKFAIANGKIHRVDFGFNQSGSYFIRSVRDDYNTENWIFTVKYHAPANADNDMAFAGFGEATPDSTGFNEPANSATFRIHGYPHNWRVDTAVHTIGAFAHPYLTVLGSLPNGAPGGVYDLTMCKSGNSMKFTLMNESSVGLTGFVPNLSTYLPGMNSTNSRIFFGSSNGQFEFSNVTVTPLVGSCP